VAGSKLNGNKRVPFFDLAGIPTDDLLNIESLIGDTLRNDQMIDGQVVGIFEKNFSAYIGVEYAIGVGNGLDAITLSLQALGLGPGSRVAVPSHTFIATWLAIIKIGAEPVGVDVDEFGQMNLDLLEREKNLDCVVIVHMHGRSCDLLRLTQWASSNGVFVVEDCAQAHGLVVAGKKAGSWGDMAAFSFYPTKNLFAMGDGGAICTSNEFLSERARSISRYGRLKNDKYRHNLDGVNSRLDSIQAAVLNYGLSNLDKWNLQRNNIANTYLTGLNLEFGARAVQNSVNHHFDIFIANRDGVRSTLQSRGINTEIHYPILAADEADYGNRDKYPIGRKISESTLSLPLSPWQSEDDTQFVIEVFNSIKGKFPN
jgi:dTDP-4-amino-4,6-dideoxygalactose transaminase